MQTMHLFAGIGGGLLADLILGHQPVVAVEWEPYACRVLRERAAEGWFSGLHVWEGDVRLFDPSEYTGKVDCIHAGFPCQDISVAGKQAGVSEGTRSGLYREVLRIAGIVRPRYLFLENVAAILSNGLGTVLGDLAAMGYDCRWLCIRASDVGAPHHRDRWFAMAYSRNAGVHKRRRFDGAREEVRVLGGNERDGLSSGCEEESDVLADADGGGTRCIAAMDEDTIWRVVAGAEFGGGREDVADSESERRRETGQFQCGEQEERIASSSEVVSNTNHERCEELDAPGISEIPGWDGRCVDARWGESWWTTEPGLGRVANGIPNRVGQLKGYGNAQVPLQAAAAWRLLGGE